MVWLTLSRNTWRSFMFKLSYCCVGWAPLLHDMVLSLSLSQWSPGMLDAAPNSDLRWFEPTVASRLRATCRGWEEFFGCSFMTEIFKNKSIWCIYGTSPGYLHFSTNSIQNCASGFDVRLVRKSCWQKKFVLFTYFFPSVCFPPVWLFPPAVGCVYGKRQRAIETSFFSSKDYFYFWFKWLIYLKLYWIF